MYTRYARKVWQVLVVVFIVQTENTRLPKLMVLIMHICSPLVV